jgi:uncharacterized protein YPO0396
VERDFSLRELEFFPQAGVGFDVRKLKVTLSDVFFADEFSGYQSKFTRLFGIASDRALRLLHKTQSAKDLGDLNKFLRDFMLDPPETFTVAETLVNEFQVLSSAHEAVLTARRQIEALRPAREALAEYDQTRAMLSSLAEERLMTLRTSVSTRFAVCVRNRHGFGCVSYARACARGLAGFAIWRSPSRSWPTCSSRQVSALLSKI